MSFLIKSFPSAYRTPCDLSPDSTFVCLLIWSKVLKKEYFWLALPVFKTVLKRLLHHQCLFFERQIEKLSLGHFVIINNNECIHEYVDSSLSHRSSYCFTQCTLFFLQVKSVKWLDHTWLCSLHSSSCQVRSSDLTVFGFTQCALFFLSSQVTWLYLTLHRVHSSSCQVKRLDCTWHYTVWTLLLVKSGDLTILDFTQCALFFLAGHGPSFDKTKLGLCCGGLWRHCIRPGRLQRFTTCFSQGRDLSHSCHHGRPCWYIS